MKWRRCRFLRPRCLVVWTVLLVIPFATAVLAQTVAPAPPALDFWGDLWSKIQQAGPFAAFIAVFFMIRAERRADKLQTERDGLLERVITGLHHSTTAVTQLTDTMNRSVRLTEAAALREATAQSARG